MIACSFPVQRDPCQNYRSAFKWLPGNVHSVQVFALRVQAFVQKHYHRDLGNIMMSFADLDVSRFQSGTSKRVVLMNYLVRECKVTWQTFSCFLNLLALSLNAIDP